MGDGTDRARRDSSGRSGGRRAAVHDGDVDDVLARHGLVGGGADPGGRRRRAEPDDDAPAPVNGTGGRRRHPDPDEPQHPARERRRRADADGDSWPPTGRRRRPEPDEPRPVVESIGGRRRRAEPDDPQPAVEATGSRRRRAEPDDPQPAVEATGGRRRRAEPDELRPAVEATGGRRRRPDPDQPRSSIEGTGGRRRRPEPDDAAALPGTRRRRPEDVAAPRDREPGRRRAPDPGPEESGGHRTADRAARHAPPGPHVDDLGGRSAGGTGNFLDGSTARGRAALESSGALQRTSAVAPGWVRANDRQGPETPSKLSGRTDRDTAPTAKVPAVGARANGRRAAFTEQATTALPARRRERPVDDGAAGGRARVLPPEPDEPDEARARENGAQRVARIDETLTRLTAAHAGLELASDRRDDDDDDLPPARPRLTPLRLLCLVLAVVVLGAAGCGYATRFWLGRAVPTVSALDAKSVEVTDAAAQKGATNVLIVTGERETIPGTGDPDATTFVVAHVPADGSDMTVLSLPAALEINRPPCEKFDPVSRDYASQTVPAEARTKLASALAVGGPRCVAKVVQQLTGLSLTSYVGVDLDELATLAETVGGVGVCLTRPVVDDALGPIAPQAGTQQLSAEHTLDYLRAREVVGDPASGAGRVERQQGVLAASLAPLLSTTGLLDIPRLIASRAVLGRTLTVDGLNLDQVHATARSLHKLDADGVRFVSAPTMTGPSGGASLVLRDAEAAELFSAVRTDKPLPAASGAAAAAGPQPGDVPVQVLNASDRSGLANTIADTLRQLGFGVGDTGNATQRTAQTIIRYSPDREAAAKLLAGSVPSATTVPDPGSNGVLQLVLGRSFDDVVRPPTSTAPAADAPQAATGSSQCS